MNISDVAKKTGLTSKAIRFYEEKGVVTPPLRSDNGYRLYRDEDLHSLAFIKRSRDLGFSVAEITDLLGLWNDKSRRSADVKRLAQQHISELDRRIASMLEMA